jgi:trimeric autotransporter adhesin
VLVRGTLPMLFKNYFAPTLSLCLLLSAASATAQNGATNFSASNSSQVVNIQQNGSGYALKAFTNSTGPVGAIFGQASGTSGFNNGVWGRTFSTAGVGVRGEALANTQGASTPTGVAGFSNFSFNGIGVYGHAQYNGFGVYGVIDSLDFSGAGVFGRAGGSCCGIPGLFQQDAAVTGGYNIILVGQYLDANKQAHQVFTVDSNQITGNAFVATTAFGGALFAGRPVNSSNNVFRVDANGAVYADGGYHTGGADFAEAFSVKGPSTGYVAGDVLTIDQSATRRLTRSSRPYSTLVAGIYSTKPGVLASPYAMDQTPNSDIPLAVIGVVPCKVTTANGAIQPGDLLVTSGKEGYAMKGTDRNKMVGAVLGKALEALPTGDGVIQVLVTLQ